MKGFFEAEGTWPGIPGSHRVQQLLRGRPHAGHEAGDALRVAPRVEFLQGFLDRYLGAWET